MSDSIKDVIRAIETETGYKVVRHSYEQRDFPDTGLGLNRRGEFAAQMITPGYVVDVTLQDGQGKVSKRRYHSDLEGSLLRESKKR